MLKPLKLRRKTIKKNKMKKLGLVFMLLVPFFMQAQTTHKGIKFENVKSWESILSQAKAAQKYVFVDCYATWCGPCKYMSENVFTIDRVGQFYNENFICVKVQLDSTKDDNEETKSFYADASAINKKYKIQVFPTYLIFSSEGELVHRFVGSMGDTLFMKKGKESLMPSTQYYVIKKKFSKSLSDSAFLRRLTISAWSLNEDYSEYAKAYIATQNSMFTKANVDFINKITRSTIDTGFKLVLNNQGKYDEMIGNGKANSFIVDIIVNEEFEKIFSVKGDKKLTKTIEERLKKVYPKQAKEAIAILKVSLYSELKDWKHYKTAISYFMKVYGAKITTSSQLNEFAWNVFDHIDDQSTLKEALKWSKKSFSGTNLQDPAVMDTYANLLYKLGRTQEAIDFETKVLKLAPDNDKTSYQETIGKMKKGEKTWTE